MTLLAALSLVAISLILLYTLFVIEHWYGRKIAMKVSNAYQIIGAILLVAAFI